ncbi:MAG: hypothetical protein R2725_07175 [Solirubrobacterales bacterium]
MQIAGPPRPPLTYLFSPFSDRERETLERFVRKVKGLQESRFPDAELNIVATPVPGPGPSGVAGWSIGIDGPEELEVKAIITDFRQIYADPHRTSARSVIAMLKRHAHERGTDASRVMIGQLKAFGKQLNKRERSDPRGYMLEETEDGGSARRTPHSIVNEWFNGVYFHDEEGPGSELDSEGNSLVEMFRWSFQATIKDFINHWGKLRILVEAILRDPAMRS